MRGLILRAVVGLLVWVLVSAAPEARAATDLPKKLQIFGHLTQAYGQSDKGSIQGVTEDGTTDLRKVAVQFRWTKSQRDFVVVQLSHERRGDDILFPKDDELEIDWAFYERRIGPHTALKAGRLNVPLGIYNEIRDVGTLLPFFNLPISFYAGVLSSAETVDGFSLAHTFAPRSDWALETEVYFGGWDTFQQQIRPFSESRFGLRNLKARAEDGLGVQLWLDTPVRGLRLGAGALTWLLTGPLSAPGVKDRWDTLHLSLDATRERWVFRAEARRWRFDQDFSGFFGLPGTDPGRAEREGAYVQLGVWLNPRWGLFGQLERTSLSDDGNRIPQLDDFHRDTAFSFDYRLDADLVLKIEYHRSKTQFPLGLPLADPNLPVPVGGPPAEVDWGIAGLSVSF